MSRKEFFQKLLIVGGLVLVPAYSTPFPPKKLTLLVRNCKVGTMGQHVVDFPVTLKVEAAAGWLNIAGP